MHQQCQLGACCLIITGNKTTLARHLFNAMHGSSDPVPASLSTNSPRNPTEFLAAPTSSLPLSMQVTLSTTAVAPNQPTQPADHGIIPVQILSMLQILSQTLQTKAPTQLTLLATSSHLISCAPPNLLYCTTHHHNYNTTKTVCSRWWLSTNQWRSAVSSVAANPFGVDYLNQYTHHYYTSPPDLTQCILRGEIIISTHCYLKSCFRYDLYLFSSWLDAWNIYIAIMVAHNPVQASEMLGYQCLIYSASKHFSTHVM